MLIVRKIPHDLSFGEVRELINLHSQQQARMTRLLREYEGNNLELDVMPRKAEGKADNRVAHAFPYIISSTICGFMNAKPIIRTVEQELIDDVFKYNDADKQNTSILLDMSIYGVGVEQFYLDRNGNTRFKRIDARDIIAIKDSSIEGEVFAIIKHFEVDGLGEDREEFVEIYYSDRIIRYYQSEDTVHSVTEEVHYFSMPPFIIYMNNEQMIGDFERVLPIVGAYNKTQSNTLNAMQDITNALMIISGAMLTDEQLRQVKELRVLADDNIDAKMVYNEVPFNGEYLGQLRKDIFALSGCIDLTGEEVGNLSGSALKQRLVNLFYICSVKANYLKEGYLKRIELIMNIHSLTSAVDVDEVIRNTEIEIKYNTLEDDTAMLQLVAGLSDIVSKETLLGLLGDKIVSVEDELAKIQAEKEQNMANFSFMQDSNGHLAHDEDTESDNEDTEDVEADTDEEEQAEEV